MRGGDKINIYVVVDNPPQVRTSSGRWIASDIYIDQSQPCSPCGTDFLPSMLNACAVSCCHSSVSVVAFKFFDSNLKAEFLWYHGFTN